MTDETKTADTPAAAAPAAPAPNAAQTSGSSAIPPEELGRITDDTPKYQGVVVYSMADLPLGFGVTAKSSTDCRHADPMTIVGFHQSDIGEYLRSEANLI